MSTETVIRLGSFLLMLISMGIVESLWPRRTLSAPKARRWLSNLSIAFLSTFLVRLIIPVVPATIALYCQKNGWGLFNIINLPYFLAVIVNVLLLDMTIYWQHVVFHRYPLLWRIHRMHHADTDIDASTGIRFHPIEILASMGIKLAAIVLLGPPVLAVILFEILLNGCALFNHANVNIPVAVDRLLRLLVVTPDMHRVHHSTIPTEFNTNYGFNFPWWDRLFKTYKSQPIRGHEDMKVGLNIFREPEFLKLTSMLSIPFI